MNSVYKIREENSIFGYTLGNHLQHRASLKLCGGRREREKERRGGKREKTIGLTYLLF